MQLVFENNVATNVRGLRALEWEEPGVDNPLHQDRAVEGRSQFTNLSPSTSPLHRGGN